MRKTTVKMRRNPQLRILPLIRNLWTSSTGLVTSPLMSSFSMSYKIEKRLQNFWPGDTKPSLDYRGRSADKGQCKITEIICNLHLNFSMSFYF